MSKFSLNDYKGKKVSSEDFVLISGSTQQDRKVMVSVSKKVAARAVDRNRIKRIIKESLKVSGLTGANIKIIVRKNLAVLKMPEIRVKLEKLFKQL